MSVDKRVYYPPGGILIWLILILEMLTFLGAIMAFSYQRSVDMAGFISSQANLNVILGTVNTLVLITSGYFMAKGIQLLKKNDSIKAQKMLLLTILFGCLFLIIKSFEYYQKIDAGFSFDSSTFFTFYWLMTGFHFVHVLFGVGLLIYMSRLLKRKKNSSDDIYDIETSGIYWHMCDLIWILIFPILYLL